MTEHYCIVCFKVHEEEKYRWKFLIKKNRKGIKRRKKYYCHLGINCAGCKILHAAYSYRSNGKVEYCDKWYNSRPAWQKRIQNMSPEEVVSGGLDGLPNQFGTNSDDYTPQVAERNKREVLESLK